MGWLLMSAKATHVWKDGTWRPGPELQKLLDDGWEPFQVDQIDSANAHESGGNCPLVWLRKAK